MKHWIWLYKLVIVYLKRTELEKRVCDRGSDIEKIAWEDYFIIWGSCEPPLWCNFLSCPERLHLFTTSLNSSDGIWPLMRHRSFISIQKKDVRGRTCLVLDLHPVLLARNWRYHRSLLIKEVYFISMLFFWFNPSHHRNLADGGA